MGKRFLKHRRLASKPEKVGEETADHLIANGAKVLIDEVRKELEGE